MMRNTTTETAGNDLQVRSLISQWGDHGTIAGGAVGLGLGLCYCIYSIYQSIHDDPEAYNNMGAEYMLFIPLVLLTTVMISLLTTLMGAAVGGIAGCSMGGLRYMVGRSFFTREQQRLIEAGSPTKIESPAQEINLVTSASP